MTMLNITATTDAEGKLRLQEMATGVPNAEVRLTLSIVDPQISDDQWRRQIRAALGKVGPGSLMRFPSGYLNDPWENED